MAAKDYNYIHIRKLITNPKLIRELKELANDKSKSELQVCYDLIAEGASTAIQEKRRNTMTAFTK